MALSLSCRKGERGKRERFGGTTVQLKSPPKDVPLHIMGRGVRSPGVEHYKYGKRERISIPKRISINVERRILRGSPLKGGIGLIERKRLRG